MSFQKILVSFFSVLIMGASFVPVAYALTGSGSAGGGTAQQTGGGSAGGGTTQGVTLENPLRSATLEGFVGDLLNILIQLGSIVIVFMLVYVGYKFVIARGEPGAISEAREALMWTVIGALILLGAKAIQMAIVATVNAIATGSQPL